jgi:hypothetical protein
MSALRLSYQSFYLPLLDDEQSLWTVVARLALSLAIDRSESRVLRHRKYRPAEPCSVGADDGRRRSLRGRVETLLLRSHPRWEGFLYGSRVLEERSEKREPHRENLTSVSRPALTGLSEAPTPPKRKSVNQTPPPRWLTRSPQRRTERNRMARP